MTCATRHVKRIALEFRSRHRRKSLLRNRNQSHLRDALRYLSVRQVASRLYIPSHRAVQTNLSVLEDIVVAPQFPHPLREVRVEVTVKYRITGRTQVAVPAASVLNLVGERGPGRDCL